MTRNLFAICLGLGLLLLAAVACGEGLEFSYGKGLPDFELKGKKFKVLGKGTLKPGESTEMRGVTFEKKAKAVLVGIGEGEGGNLDMFVVDAKTGRDIGKDVLLDNVPVVVWTTGADDRFLVNLRLENAGKAPCKFVLIANW